MAPAAAATVLFGVLLAGIPGTVDWRSGWIWAKLALVLGLGIFHMLLAAWCRQFAAGRVPHTSRFFRRVNELPAVALIAIVILVVVKPF
jgi:putative membrane protein